MRDNASELPRVQIGHGDNIAQSGGLCVFTCLIFAWHFDMIAMSELDTNGGFICMVLIFWPDTVRTTKKRTA